MKALVAGWFSFENGHATAGDLLARDLACEWMKAAALPYDVAAARPFDGDVDLHAVDPTDYSHVVFVCGPFTQGELEARLLHRFGRCRLVGLNLSMEVPLDVWNPFDVLIERDSSEDGNPDVVFHSPPQPVPVVGVCLVESYPGAIEHVANAAIERLTASRPMAVVPIDTRLDVNSTGLRTPSEIESLIARMDVLITTRLHGTVLALKHGVPVLAIDPMPGGAKIRRQAETIGWPIVFHADALDDDALRAAFEYCLTDAARTEAASVGARAKNMLEAVRDRFVETLSHSDELEQRYRARLAEPQDGKWMERFVQATASPAPKPATAGNRAVRWKNKFVRVLRRVSARRNRASESRPSTETLEFGHSRRDELHSR